MAEAKIEIKVGSVSFVGEGAQAWLAQQLDKVLEKLPEFAGLPNAGDGKEGAQPAPDPGGKPHHHAKPLGTLAAFLKEKKATSNQARKFLATAVWLHDTENKHRVTTAEVTKF